MLFEYRYRYIIREYVEVTYNSSSIQAYIVTQYKLTEYRQVGIDIQLIGDSLLEFAL